MNANTALTDAGTAIGIAENATSIAKGANQAVAAARSGAKVTIITKLGKDNIGHYY